MKVVRDNTADIIRDFLNEVKDPEVPVLNINDLGVLRAVELVGDQVIVTITPTYSGCPAMKIIEDQIETCLVSNGYPKYKINTVLSPAWTTDWMTNEGRRKLEAYGVAPPQKDTQDKSQLFPEPKKINCPRCKGLDTEMISQFGSTACKALYKCRQCLEPFDYFKCL